MWSIENTTPFAAGQAFTQHDQTGEVVWMVALKATFDMDMETNRPIIADEQEDPSDADEFKDDPINSSLAKCCDFALAKQNVDVWLDATAYSPGGEPVTELMTGVIVGSVRKTLTVYGNRYYDRFLGILYHSPPNKFNHMPITYEKAYGGWERSKKDEFPPYEHRNPAGTGFFKRRSSAIDQTLPNIEYPGFPTKRKSKKNRIAGYGPIPLHWEPRAQYAGTIENNPERDVSVVRPKDFNPLFYQKAPQDQQLQNVTGGEPVILYNMHPEHSEIQSCLPTIDITFESLIENETYKQSGKLQSIIIHPEKLKLQMVWQANIRNGRDASAIKGTKISHTIHKL